MRRAAGGNVVTMARSRFNDPIEPMDLANMRQSVALSSIGDKAVRRIRVVNRPLTMMRQYGLATHHIARIR
jgi:hypothetical protein